MKLYYAPFACSFAPHIAWREAGLDVKMFQVDLTTKQVDDGGNLYDVNPMGQVPTLVTDDGQVLSENAAVLAYIADQAPQRGLAPDPTSPARYEFLRWLSFLGNELHKKVLNPVFTPTTPDAVREHARATAPLPLQVLAAHLETRQTLLGQDFSAADAYLVWALLVCPHAGVPLQPYPALLRYHERHASRPAVAAARDFERQRYQA